ncbi:hypothetical protein DB346_15430 [Verrucomicrobia bacterium LW23]|nr:hypothetical protein DB346_15430 [Verrucomicrobia bacterium LW23]
MTSRSITDPARFAKVLRETVVLPIGLIVLAALVQTAIIVELFAVVGWYNHSGTIIARMHECEKRFVSMEIGWRKNLLRRDAAYPETLAQERAELTAALRNLQQQVSDNPEQVRMVQEVMRACDAWGDFVVGTFEPSGLPVAQSLPVSVRERNFVVQRGVHAAVEQFVDREERVRAARYAQVHHMEWAALAGGVAICLTLAFGVGWHVWRQLAALSHVYETSLEIIAAKNAELEISRNRLGDQKEWFRVILASIGDGVIVTDRRMVVQFLNGTAEKMAGRDRREILQKDFHATYRLTHLGTGSPARQGIENALVRNEVVPLSNLTLARQGREPLAVDATAAPITDVGGLVQGLVLVFRDATARHEAERAQRNYAADLEKQVEERTYSLQRALVEMQSFSYTISHDLRSPLRAMQGYAVAILEDDPNLSDDTRRYLERIRLAAERLDKLIRDLLDYSRISFLDPATEAIDLEALIDEILEQYGNLRAPGIHITVEKPLLPVQGRQITLVQVLSNLLSNAAKFVRPGEEARIRVYTREVKQSPRPSTPLPALAPGGSPNPADTSVVARVLKPDGQTSEEIRDEPQAAPPTHVRICVQDNGIGIAPDDLAKIFGMFVQAGPGQKYGGTGVGLAIVKKAAEGMGGTVGVESLQGSGSTFWVELPRAASKPAAPAATGKA